MPKRVLVFSGVFLYIKNTKINLKEFQDTLLPGTHTKKDSSKVEIHKLDYEGEYLKITFEDGAIGRRNPIVYNFTNEEEEPNPRSKEQVEPKETFAILDFKTSYMWISNSKKRNMLISLLQSYFPNVQIVAKDIYDEEQFITTLKKIDSIKVSAVPNLFSQTGTLSERLAEEINGYEASVATVSFKYYNSLTTKFIENKIRTIFAKKTSLRSIVISGRDEKNLGMLFNTDGFSRKIEIEATVDDDEMFDEQDVFKELIKNLNSENT